MDVHMNKLKSMYVTSRKEWRRWLEKNFDKEKEIWLIFPKKSSGKPRILYNDAVEEALCFGWIDSTVRMFDEENTIQRFTPRKPKSRYSQANKERLRWLQKEKMIHPSMVDAVKKVLKEKFILENKSRKRVVQLKSASLVSFERSVRGRRTSHFRKTKLHHHDPDTEARKCGHNER